MRDDPGPVRVIVHAGFHKTGTTSCQDFLTANRAALAPWISYFGKDEFGAAGAGARLYAQRPFAWRLRAFRRSLRLFLAGVTPKGTLILSRETLSGGMPGHRRLSGAVIGSYLSAAKPLSDVILQELRRRFGADVDVAFYYTLRAREAWLASVHGHLLRSIRMTEDLDSFRAAMADVPGPAEQAAEMARHLAPVQVVTARLEDFADNREGLAAPLLDMAKVPADVRRALTTAPRSNMGQSADLRRAFLDLNRQHRDRDVLRAAKARLMAEHAS